MTGALFRGEIEPIELTPDQREAADPGASAWVEASAGTGKTQVLTARVLRLLLEGAAPTRILCLTFTRAAAAEMATRIAQRLGIWTFAPDDALRHDLEALGHPETGNEAMARAPAVRARARRAGRHAHHDDPRLLPIRAPALSAGSGPGAAFHGARRGRGQGAAA